MEDLALNQLSTVLQWNCQGLRTSKQEVVELVNTFKPCAVALQETKLWGDATVNIAGYRAYSRNGHFNVTAHGGTAIYVHQSVPVEPLRINTEYQAVAVRIHVPQSITLCSVYLSRSHDLRRQGLQGLYDQLPQPVLMMGDFNSYSTRWGSSTTDARGRMVEEFAEDNDLNILNTGAATRVAFETETCIDLSIATPVLAPILEWTVTASPRDSDHIPIIVKLLNARAEGVQTERRNMKRADWVKYRESNAWRRGREIENMGNEELLLDLYSRINEAAEEAIPKIKCGKFYPKPFWNDRLKRTRETRERQYKKYRRRKSMQNYILWKRAKAEHRQAVIEEKRASWIKLASTFNYKTPKATIYENVRKIKGNRQRKINVLKEGDQYYTTHQEIANRLGQTFSNISSAENYQPNFKRVKDQEERKNLNFQSNEEQDYNKKFSLEELEAALQRTKNTVPGPDDVHYRMLREMPLCAKQYLLKIYNKFWNESYFPRQWRDATVVAFPKPDKDHSKAENYRPIALTSCLSKTLERMINTRLCDYLEMKKELSNIQNGGRRGRSTTDHLVRLETAIRRCFAHGKLFVSVFFDLKKAYDTTWKYGIMRDLYRMGLRGRMPLYIKEFLTDRRFKVRMEETYSENFSQEEGVPQGSVLSVTLFTIKINQLRGVLPNDSGMHTSLYVDDFQMGYSGTDINLIQRRLQQYINTIEKWTEDNGFSFSLDKTKAVLFSQQAGIQLRPDLLLYGQKIKYEESVKFLGLIFDSKLTWRAHITSVKAKCSRAVGVLKSIATQEWGGDMATMVHLYRVMVRSVLDYGCVVYQSACVTTKGILEPVANECMRIATGAFKSTPTESLNILCNEMTLEHRRQYLTLKYYYKMRSQLDNPAFNVVVSTPDRLLFRNKGIPPPLAIRARELIERLNLPTISICPAFSYTLLNIQKPAWDWRVPKFNEKMTANKKQVTTEQVYREQFHMLNERFEGHKRYYTDGSKSETGVGAAVVSSQQKWKVSLPRYASSFTAEVHAMRLACDIIQETEEEEVVIFTDSMSVIKGLKDKQSANPLIRKLQYQIDGIMQSKSLVICWVPSHVGIRGNERVDTLAKEAAAREQPGQIYYADYYSEVKRRMKSSWEEEWRTRQNHLRMIADTPGSLEQPRGSRRDQVVINRLRLGHSWLSHGHLMNREVQEPPRECPFCMASRLTVKHIMIECPRLQIARRRHLSACRNTQNIEIKKILGREIIESEVVEFMRAIGAYSGI